MLYFLQNNLIVAAKQNEVRGLVILDDTSRQQINLMKEI